VGVSATERLSGAANGEVRHRDIVTTWWAAVTMAAEDGPADQKLTDLSLALIVRCLKPLSAADIVAVSQTCVQLRSAALDDSQLWRPIFKAKWNLPPDDGSPKPLGWLCQEYRAREHLMSILPQLPGQCVAGEWGTVMAVTSAFGRLLFTGQPVDVTCATLSHHCAGASLVQACVTVAAAVERGDATNHARKAFNVIAMVLPAWLQCVHQDSAERQSALVALASDLNQNLQNPKLPDNWRVSVAGLLASIQRSIWFTGSPGPPIAIAWLSRPFSVINA